MKVLVAGGAGYIGGVVAAALLERGQQVVVLDDLSSGHRDAVPQGAKLIQQDLSDLPALRRALERDHVDAVMHFAGNIQVGESMRLPMKYLGDNVRNSLNLLEAMVDVGVKRIIFSSTAALFAPSDRPIAEDSPIRPASPYGESKYAIERAMQWLDTTAGLRYASLRYFNAAGAWQGRGERHDPETHLIPLVLAVAAGRSEAVDLYGEDYPTPDGTCVRDYIHVLDLAEAHILALAALDCGSSVYNLGNGKGFSVREVIEVARRVTGHEIPVRSAPRRPGDAPWLVADSQKIRAELGWQPRITDLETIVASAWEWHLTRPEVADGRGRAS
ncbi:MAG: UDP-glucose 4-epimerase GalE [Anaerolineae bacterium]